MAKILYIEDDELLRDTTELMLHRFGHSVITRVDTSHADAIADQWKPDLVITDHQLGPGKETGLELAKRLHDKGHKVVMLSGSPEAFDDAVEAGIHFFYKPCCIASLLESAGL